MKLQYRKGQEPDFWSPDPEEQSHRFALGNVSRTSTGAPPLIALCMNPSAANRAQADRTVNRVVQASIDNGCAGWVMLNLYPERATNPTDLSPYDTGLSSANCQAIELVVTRFAVSDVLGAWGDLPHPTLRRARSDVLDTLDRIGVGVFTFDGLTARGNPFHPTPRGTPLVMQGTKRLLIRNGSRLVEQPASTYQP